MSGELVIISSSADVLTYCLCTLSAWFVVYHKFHTRVMPEQINDSTPHAIFRTCTFDQEFHWLIKTNELKIARQQSCNVNKAVFTANQDNEMTLWGVRITIIQSQVRSLQEVEYKGWSKHCITLEWKCRAVIYQPLHYMTQLWTRTPIQHSGKKGEGVAAIFNIIIIFNHYFEAKNVTKVFW